MKLIKLRQISVIEVNYIDFKSLEKLEDQTKVLKTAGNCIKSFPFISLLGTGCSKLDQANPGLVRILI